jgi:Subtilase family
MKKLLFVLLVLLLLLLLLFYCRYCSTNPSPPITPTNTASLHQPNQLIVNFENETDVNAFLFELKQKPGFAAVKLVGSCPCSKKLILLEGTPNVELNPDDEVNGQVKKSGGNGSGVSLNYLFEGFEKIPDLSQQVIYRFGQPNSPISEVKVSIIDSGVDTSNAKLKPYLFNNQPNLIYCGDKKGGIYGLNMLKASMGLQEAIEPIDNNGHGTFINGIIAGQADVPNKSRAEVERFTGGNENVAIRQMNVSFTPPNSKAGTLFDALCGIHYSLNQHAKVINASWGLVTFGRKVNEMKIFNSTLMELSNPDNDALLVVSAGNDSISFKTDSLQRMAWPAAFSIKQNIGDTILDFSNNVITVGAWNMYTNSISVFSNRDKDIVNVYAPGDSIMSIKRNSDTYAMEPYNENKGTSFATPFVTRTVAIMRGVNRNLPAKAIKAALMKSAELYYILPSNPSTAIPLLRNQEAINSIRPHLPE